MNKYRLLLIPFLIIMLFVVVGCHGTTTIKSLSHSELGQQYLKAGDYDKAIEEFNAVLMVNSHDATILANRGIAFYFKGNFVQAISDLSFAIEFNPRLSTAYYYRALAYSTDGGIPLAIDDLTRMIELEPANSAAYFLRANMYGQWNKPGEGIPDLQKIIELDNDADLVQRSREMLSYLLK